LHRQSKLYMAIAATNCRRFISCLAILASLASSLQQCHAFCVLTECESECGSKTCEACQAKKSCCQRHEHAAAPKIESACCHHSVTQQQPAPCQDHCWCCRQSDPVSAPSDETSRAKEVLAASVLMSLDSFVGVPVIRLSGPRECMHFARHSLCSAEFCVALCRFRI
jgi:hypothetical protein